uniref:Serine/threonine specific protein phosphatases domain-containing protein n=1 Tax=Nelumbo nucifera TaxID=4432 RepID=A0A822ZMH1_NELNU|nr:TPA_asm: hypothetical protein HUJ06_017161 [Nelumbo nucifera]
MLILKKVIGKETQVEMREDACWFSCPLWVIPYNLFLCLHFIPRNLSHSFGDVLDQMPVSRKSECHVITSLSHFSLLLSLIERLTYVCLSKACYLRYKNDNSHYLHRSFNVRLWKTFTDCFNCLPVAALIDDKILCMHGGLSPDLKNLDQIRNIARPVDVPDQGLLRDLWSDPDKDIQGWRENDRGVSYTFGADKVTKFLQKHDLDLICRAHQ